MLEVLENEGNLVEAMCRHSDEFRSIGGGSSLNIGVSLRL